MNSNNLFAILIATAVITISSNTNAASEYKPNWRWIKAADGMRTAIDLNSISRGTGFADAVVYFDRGSANWMQDNHRYRFDCKGHFMDIDSRGTMIPAPPDSVVAKMAAIACVGVKTTCEVARGAGIACRD
jgi:hypothetical protein